VLAVPEIAITQGLMGPRVFTLDDDDVTHATNVTPGEVAGPWVIISDGLEIGDRVIVSDPGAIEAGMKIKPQEFHGDAEAISAQQEQAQSGARSEQNTSQGDQSCGGGEHRDSVTDALCHVGLAGGVQCSDQSISSSGWLLPPRCRPLSSRSAWCRC